MDAKVTVTTQIRCLVAGGSVEVDHLAVPFSTVPCCDVHDEYLTRAQALAAGRDRWLHLAASAGVHPLDMAAFLKGEVSLTPRNRERIREVLR